MKTSTLIARIRAQCPSFANRVAGAAEFMAAVEYADDLALPHAFVMRLADAPQDSSTAGQVLQVIEELFGVVVAVDNTTDQRGQGADDALDDLLVELQGALVGWQPDALYQDMEYRGSTLLDMDRARLWRQFDFVTLIILKE